MENPFKPLEQRNLFVKVAVNGPTGAGKTWSAMLIALGLGKKIAAVDTENRSMANYAKKMPGIHGIVLEPPFTVTKYIKAIQAAQAAGYDTLIIDSLSHAWAGSGGLLDQKAKLDARPGANSFTNWNKVTPVHERLKEAILQAKMHIIVTMRTKMEYVLNKDENTGKSRPSKIGMKPIQRDDMEYEFTLVLDILHGTHEAIVGKDRTGLFDGREFVPTIKTGEELAKWADGGTTVPDQSAFAEGEKPPGKTDDRSAAPADLEPKPSKKPAAKAPAKTQAKPAEEKSEVEEKQYAKTRKDIPPIPRKILAAAMSPEEAIQTWNGIMNREDVQGDEEKAANLIVKAQASNDAKTPAGTK